MVVYSSSVGFCAPGAPAAAGMFAKATRPRVRAAGRPTEAKRRLRVQMIVGTQVLNRTKKSAEGDVRTNVDVDAAGELQLKIKSLYVDHLDVEGDLVDYDALGKSEGFQEYEKESQLLAYINPTRLSRDERLAFFLNIYNALVIHAVVRMGKPPNIPARLYIYANASYDIGGSVFSLDDIEHNVLRGNKQQRLDPFGFLKFGPSDARYKTIVDPVDPRIHFGLNCGAVSCPPIRFYTADNVDYALGISTENFIDNDDNVRVLPKTGVVYLSQLFKWYKEDFAPKTKSDAELVQWIADNADENTEKKADLLKVLEAQGTPKIEWLTYDWSLNSM